jgi:uncharacterized protein
MNFGAKLYESDEEENTKPKVVGINQPSGLLRKTQRTHDSSKVAFGKTEEDNLGVFARTDIRDGELIEVAPLILIDGDVMAVDKLNDYIFTINKEEDLYALAFGYASLYNHNEEPSAEWAIDIDKEQIRFIAKKAIVAGEQITISYGSSYWESRNEDK